MKLATFFILLRYQSSNKGLNNTLVLAKMHFVNTSNITHLLVP